MDFVYKFSIIIPTYNRAILLERCLKSLIKQTYRNFEVLVCDDGSTDNSEEITLRFNKNLNIKYLWEKNWGGPARPRNRGISVAQGEWLCFLDSDDWWKPNKLEQTLMYLESYDFIYHGMYIASNSISQFGKQHLTTRQVKNKVIFDLLTNSNLIPNSSVAVRKTIIDKIGNLSEERELIAVEDFDYWIRVAQVTDRFKYIPQQLGYYSIGQNISFSLKQIEKEEYLYKKYENLLTDKQRYYANIMLEYNRARLLHQFGYFKKAILLYVNILKSKINNRIKLNSIIALLFCIIKYKY